MYFVSDIAQWFQMAFFRQHNISTSDAAVKYKSRAAQLYRDKLHQMAAQALRVHGTSKVILLHTTILMHCKTELSKSGIKFLEL